MRDAMKKWIRSVFTRDGIRQAINRVVCFVVLETFLLTGGGFVAAQAVSAPTGPDAHSGIVGSTPAPKALNLEPQAQVLRSRTFVLDPEKASRISFEQVTLDVPAGAVSAPLTITIQELPSVQPMNDGMKNVTGKVPGYRFMPNGTRFKRDLTLTLPYDKDQVASARAANEVYTYFYDEGRHWWQGLKRVRFDSEAGLVTSVTNHFTDFVNSTLALPESPKPLSYNPN